MQHIPRCFGHTTSQMSHFRPPPASILMIRFGTHLRFSEQLCFPTTPAFFTVFFWCGPFWKSLLNLLQYYFCFMFCFFSYKACGILAPRPGIGLAPPCIGSLCFPLDQLSCYIASLGNSLVVQWLKFCASTSRGPGSVPGWEIKIPQTSKKKNCFFNLLSSSGDYMLLEHRNYVCLIYCYNISLPGSVIYREDTSYAVFEWMHRMDYAQETGRLKYILISVGRILAA